MVVNTKDTAWIEFIYCFVCLLMDKMNLPGMCAPEIKHGKKWPISNIQIIDTRNIQIE